MSNDSEKNNLVFHNFSEHLRQIRPDLYTEYKDQLTMEDGVLAVWADDIDENKEIIYGIFRKWASH